MAKTLNFQKRDITRTMPAKLPAAPAVRPAAAAVRRAPQPRRLLCARPAATLSGSPVPQPPSSCSPPPSPSSPKTLKKTSPSLPTMLAGLSTGALLGAAALHSGSPDHAVAVASAASSAVTALATDFGPADVIAQSFGPTRPLWAALVHSHAAHSAASTAMTAPAAPPSSAAVADGATGAGMLLQQARVAVTGAVNTVCEGYNRWLEESPLVCKIVTGNFFTVAGDMLAQVGLGGAGGHGGEQPAAAPAAAAAGTRRRVDWARTGRLCLETSAVGTPLGHWWFGLLDGRIMPDDPHCPAAVLTKMLLDQVLFAPFGLAVFFIVIKCLEGRPKDIPTAIRTSYIRALLGGYLLWPAAGLLNFALLPPEYRLLFNNVVNILWTCFLSIMSSGDSSSKASPQPAASDVHAATEAAPGAGATAVASAASELAVTAITMMALGAAMPGRASFGYVAGLAVAAVEAALMTHGSVHEPEPALAPAIVAPSAPVSPSAMSVLPPSFSGGASVAMGGPCLEVCEEPVEALYELRPVKEVMQLVGRDAAGVMRDLRASGRAFPGTESLLMVLDKYEDMPHYQAGP
ncbi:hypothetical protein GPECTOR_7g1163 [Gonium pectorale]|uniref:Uncharacterized protein n=1 Tax=Gonium pectorale TaxID=33097 RepID=A0A150GTW1_GONPE|nr:hypothetical protein GPECTOR_7g1163 [Gonium pectorale]|eukprot:KXZ53269.1 hypothetical protein GPECTOR_7g1163 [Gonium pectorale]